MVLEGPWFEPALVQNEQDVPPSTASSCRRPTTSRRATRPFPEQFMIASGSKHKAEAAVPPSSTTSPSSTPSSNSPTPSAPRRPWACSPTAPSGRSAARSPRSCSPTVPAYPPTDQAFEKELMDSFFEVQDGIVAGKLTPAEGAKLIQQRAEAWKAKQPASILSSRLRPARFGRRGAPLSSSTCTGKSDGRSSPPASHWRRDRPAAARRWKPGTLTPYLFMAAGPGDLPRLPRLPDAQLALHQPLRLGRPVAAHRVRRLEATISRRCSSTRWRASPSINNVWWTLGALTIPTVQSGLTPRAWRLNRRACPARWRSAHHLLRAGSVLPLVAVGIIWSWMYNPNFGAINVILKSDRPRHVWRRAGSRATTPRCPRPSSPMPGPRSAFR
jgi:hypothetical protein